MARYTIADILDAVALWWDRWYAKRGISPIERDHDDQHDPATTSWRVCIRCGEVFRGRGQSNYCRPCRDYLRITASNARKRAEKRGTK